eukprot:12211276-Alexandrium_andersonii.AAC.1
MEDAPTFLVVPGQLRHVRSWRGCSMNGFRTVSDVAQLVGDRANEDATAACAASLAAVRETRLFFRHMSETFESQ